MRFKKSTVALFLLVSGVVLFWRYALIPTSVERTRIAADTSAIGLEEATVDLFSRTPGGTNEGTVPKGQIRVLDRKIGAYSFEWIGNDGGLKSITYHRPDRSVVTVSASRGATQQGERVYRYELKNDPSSGQYLSGFIVQTFSSGARPISIAGAYVGRMGKHISEFSQGSWYRYGNDVFGDEIVPGSSIVVELASSAPAEIVECKVHSGPMKMMGVGEEMPPELAERLPGYEAWPSGHTIGPSDNPRLTTFAGRAEYVLSKIDLLARLGWLHPSRVDDYRTLLTNSPSESSLENIIREDFESGLATSEILTLLDL